MPGTKRADIEQFLKEFKAVWKGLVIPRPENDKTLLELGLTPYHRANEIRKLTYKKFLGALLLNILETRENGGNSV